MATKNERAAIRQLVEAALVGSKRFPVEIVGKASVMTRNEKGQITGSKMVYEVTGHGVSDAFKRNYFKRTRIEKLAAEGFNINMPRMARNSGKVVVELQA